jgi:hypothetical protein
MQLADEAQKAKIDEILALLNKMMEITDQVDEPLTEMLADIRTETRDLEALLPETVLAEPEEETGDSLLPGAALPGADLPGGETPAGGAEPAGGTAPAGGSKAGGAKAGKAN